MLDGPGSSLTRPTSPRRRDRARCRRSISLRPRPRRRNHPRLNQAPNLRTSVDADFAVELGSDDETRELPCAAGEGGPRYYDVKRRPGLLLDIEEVRRVPELGEFIAAI